MWNLIKVSHCIIVCWYYRHYSYKVHAEYIQIMFHSMVGYTILFGARWIIQGITEFFFLFKVLHMSLSALSSPSLPQFPDRAPPTHCLLSCSWSMGVVCESLTSVTNDNYTSGLKLPLVQFPSWIRGVLTVNWRPTIHIYEANSKSPLRGRLGRKPGIRQFIAH